MRQGHLQNASTRSSEKLLFSAVFIGALIAVTTALYAIDIATVRALLSLP